MEKIIAEATKLKKEKKQKLIAKVDDDALSEDEEAAKPEEEVVKSSVIGIEEAGLHIVLKKILKNDKERLQQNKDSPTFGSILLRQLTDETVSIQL